MILKKYSPALVTGFAVAVLSLIPVFKVLACCFLVPAASFFALFFYLKINPGTEKIKFEEAMIFGLLTGVVAAIFSSALDLVLTYITRTNDLIESLPYSSKMLEEYKMGDIFKEQFKILNIMEKDIKNTGFSLYYMFMIIFSNLLSFTFFGLLGGLAGMAILNKKKTNNAL